MSLRHIVTHRPVWGDDRDRHAGTDEDVVTLAVAAGRAALDGHDADGLGRIVLVSRTLDSVQGVATGVLAVGLSVGSAVPVEVRVGGAADCLDALAEAAPHTLVIAVDVDEPSCASAAALVGTGPGLQLRITGRGLGSLPMRVRHVGDAAVTTYHDPRVERDLASAPLVAALRDEGEVFVAGLPPGEARRVGGAKTELPTTGAAGALFQLAELAETLGGSGRSARLVGLDGATGVGADIRLDGPVRTERLERAAVPASHRPRIPGGATEIPFSMPAYARAFDAKVGWTAARCACGELSYPPRTVCLRCGEYDRTTPVELPRTGEVYSIVTVHVPVPAMPGPYALAIVALDDVPVRVLAKVTDAPATAVAIGDRGRMVLRRVAVREGFPDYGYAFQPDGKEPLR
jgi:uncharacterized OB-fold protein